MTALSTSPIAHKLGRAATNSTARTVVARAAGSAAVLVFTIVIGWRMSVDDAGAVLFLVASSQFASNFLRTGLDVPLLRAASDVESPDAARHARTLLDRSLLRALRLGAAAVVGLGGALWLLGTDRFGEFSGAATLLAIVSAPLYTAALIALEVDKGAGNAARASLFQTGLIQFVALPPLLLLPSLTQTNVLAAFAVATGVNVVAAVVVAYRHLPGRLDVRPPALSAADHQLAMSAWAVDALRIAGQWAPAAALAAFGDPAGLGRFMLASRLAAAVNILVVAVNNSSSPPLARSVRRGDASEVGSVCRRVAVLVGAAVAGLSLLALVGLGATGDLLPMALGDVDGALVAMLVAAVGVAGLLAFGTLALQLLGDVRPAVLIALGVQVASLPLLVPAAARSSELTVAGIVLAMALVQAAIVFARLRSLLRTDPEFP